MLFLFDLLLYTEAGPLQRALLKVVISAETVALRLVSAPLVFGKNRINVTEKLIYNTKYMSNCIPIQ